MSRTPERAGSSPAAARFDVVALVTSAGGLNAIRAILRDLPDDLPSAVIVAQHLGGQGSTLVQILRRQSKLPVDWASPDARLAPGRVLVCPPRRQLEILPDGTCVVAATEIGASEKPLDLLLQSIADSYGARALAVVLTGMGRDAAAGAAAVKRAGGIVLAQSEDTAEQPSMPRAAAAHADLVLPLHEIGGVIANVVAGGSLPRPRAEIEAAEVPFSGTGEVRRLLAAVDWSTTPLGPVARWPVSLRTTLRLVLDSPAPMCILWGPDLIQLYNDRYSAIMGEKHPASLAQPNRACWPEVWELNAPIYARVFRGESVALADAPYPIARRDVTEDAWFDLSFAPVMGDDGGVAGVLTTIVETTGRVLSERRLRSLQALTAETSGVPDVHAAMERALASLVGDARDGDDGADVPFALAYLIDAANGPARLVAASGVEAGGPIAPRTIDIEGMQAAWPLAAALAKRADPAPLVVSDLTTRFRGHRIGAGKHAATSALLLPLRPVADEPPVGVLVCGINPRLALDATYRAFLDLVAARVSASLGEAQLRQRARDRLERMAELDRAKSEFFSNVSHEFRTPLTLLLAPLEELTRRRDELPPALAEDLAVAARNARRLLGQVNTLLDFSQAEARRLRAQFEETDLAALTRDIASLFRGAADRAGIQLRVECPPLAEPVWVDPEMWEKIVGNLLSNALKFTFTGEIVVQLTTRAKHAELLVRDTGVGIPADEQPHVFERFHRVRGRHGRTHEGSGIGLALVYELVRMHRGRVRVQSQEGAGTSMTVWVPLGRPPARASAADGSAATAAPPAWAPEAAVALAEEAEAWTAAGAARESEALAGEARAIPHGVADDLLGPAPARALRDPARRKRLLVVDDNVDMRSYLARLLEPQWDVAMASDGADALAMIRSERPDMVIADVMLPGIDGFELLHQVRRDEALKYTPVVLVTARAGEEAAIEGLRAGADDYIAKPFSPRELVARVQAVAERSRVDAALRERAAWRRGQREALEAAMNGASLDTSLAALVAAANETLGDGIRAAFYLANHDGTTLHHVVGMGPDYAAAVDGFRIGPESLAGGLATTGSEPVLTTDVMSDPRWEPWRWLARRFDYRGCWSFPIHSSAGQFVGTFAVYAREPRDPTPRDLELASLFTQTASIILARHAESVARKQAEDKLRETNERTAKLLSLMPTAVYTCDAEGRITFFNRRAAELWGREPALGDDEEKFCGSYRMRTLSGAPLSRADSAMAAAVREGRAARNVEVVLEQPAGGCVVVSASIDPLYDREGRLVGAINVFADTTEQSAPRAKRH